MDASDYAGDLARVRQITGLLPDIARSLAAELHCSAADLWRIYFAASGSMCFPDETEHGEVFADGPWERRGITRYELWYFAVSRALQHLGRVDTHIYTGFYPDELRPSIDRLFEALGHSRTSEDTAAREVLPAGLQELIARIAAPMQGASTVLVAQAESARLVSSSFTMVVVDVPAECPGVDLPDGPIPCVATIDSGTKTTGKLNLWIRSGRIYGIEQEWYTEQPPTSWPSTEMLRRVQPRL